MTTTVSIIKLNEVENKMLDIISLVTATALNQKILELQNKILHNSKYIKTEETFTARLKEDDLVSKIS